MSLSPACAELSRKGGRDIETVALGGRGPPLALAEGCLRTQPDGEGASGRILGGLPLGHQPTQHQTFIDLTAGQLSSANIHRVPSLGQGRGGSDGLDPVPAIRESCD